MTWIKTIAFADAAGPLRKLYQRVSGPDENVDNIMLAHSLRPHTMEGHMALYKHVLHHPRNAADKYFLEAIGVYTSLLNRCGYCVEHHFKGMARLLADDDRAAAMRTALESGDFAASFSGRESAALDYARKLTEGPALILSCCAMRVGTMARYSRSIRSPHISTMPTARCLGLVLTPRAIFLGYHQAAVRSGSTAEGSPSALGPYRTV